MSKHVELQFVWDGDADAFAYLEVPSALIPAIGTSIIVYPHRWVPNGKVTVDDDDDDEADQDGDWVEDGPPVRATILDHRIDIAVYPLEKRDNGTHYDDDPTMYLTLILGKLGA